MQILSKINWVDILVVILILRTTYASFMDGLSHEIFPFLGTLAVFVLSLNYYKILGELISSNLENIPIGISNWIAFILLIVALGFIVKLLKIILDKIVRVQWHPVIEKFGGLLAGVLKAYIITAMVLTVFVLSPLSYLRWSVNEKSLTGKYILLSGPQAVDRLKPFLSDNSTQPKTPPANKEPSE